jgi:hypothetical protein
MFGRPFIGLNGAGYLVFGERTISGGNISSQQTWRYIPSSVSIDDINNINSFQLVSSQNRSLIFKSKSTQKANLMVWTLDGKLILNTEQVFSSDHSSVMVDYAGMVVYQVSNSQGQIKSGKCFIN